ncbi:MAG: hypothetical protein AAGC46_03600 [Solirubrobacteraceae bacterium]|nr:hypothetical protein [Patulibacter sp.]
MSAVPELTADPEFTANGIRLQLRIGLDGAGLPDGCGVGTAEDPLVIDLTNGTTTPPDGVTPLTGNQGSASFDAINSIITSSHIVYVDNGYAVPAASGCGATIAGQDVGSVDGAINTHAGLPAAAGASETYARDARVSAAFDLTKVFGS